MKFYKHAFAILALGLIFALPCKGAEQLAEPSQPRAQPEQILDDTARQPVQSELGAEAKETLGYLLFVQSIFDEDEAELLAAAELLAQHDTSPEIWLDGGIWLVSRKSPNSIPYLEQARKALPEDLSLLLLYAEALGDHDMASRGIEVMNEYLKKHPDSLDGRIELALLLVKDRKFAEAQKMLNAITGKQRTPIVEYYQAKALMGMGRSEEAIPYLRKATNAMPDFDEALAELAFLYEQSGKLREARATYEKLQKLHFSPQEVALRLIRLSLRLKQPEKALQYFRQGPNSLPFHIMAAQLFMDSRHFLQAENILKEAAKSPDAPVEVYLLLADLSYEQRKNLADALDWLNKIPPKIPDYQKASILRAQLLAEAGKTEEAIKVTENSMRENPDNPEFPELLIRLLAKEKKLPEALAQARKAREKWPSNQDLDFLLASLLDESGDKKEAMRIMEEIIAKNPDYFQALNYVGFTLADENREIDRALDLLKHANELAPGQPYIMDSLAWALYRAGRLNEALAEIKRATSRQDANDPAIWEHYGDIAAKIGKKEEARKAYRKSLDLKPDNAADVRAKMNRL